MSIVEEWRIRLIRDVPKIFSKRNVCCGLAYIVLHTIAWPSFVVWILLDIGLFLLLIIPGTLRFINKEPTRANVMIPGSVNGRGGFNSVMSETLNSHVSEGRRTRSSSRRPKYDHEFSRYTPDQRDTRTPLPTISAIKNRLSYSTAEASIRSTTPNPFSPNATNTLQERNRMLHNSSRSTTHHRSHNPSRSTTHHHTPNESRSSSVLHIARTNLPVAKEVCSPVVVKVAPLGTSPRVNLKEAKPNPNTCSKEVVVNALKQITQKRKRVRPSYDSREGDTLLSDNIPSVKRSRKEPASQQTVKRTWTKAAITNESFSKPLMPETKKHKASSDITEGPPLLQESAVMTKSPPPAAPKATATELDDDTEETAYTASDKEVTQLLSTSDKENESLDNENKEEKVTFGILKKLRTVYPSTKPSVDAMRRKYPILCSSGVAPRLGRRSLKLKYEDYVKDREDVYAKVKQVLEEVDEAELQKKKAEDPPATSEPVGALSGTVKGVTSALLVPQPNTTRTAAVQSATTNTLLSTSSTISASNTTSPPPNVVISSRMSEVLPTGRSISGHDHQPTITIPATTTTTFTSKLAEVSSAVSSNNLTYPTLPSLVGTTTSKASQMFSFPLPNALSTVSTSSNSQIKQPTPNFSMPVSSTLTTSSSSLAAGPTISLGIGTTSSISTSVNTGTTLGVSSSLGIGLSFPSSLGANQKLQLPNSATTTATNTIQLQTSLPHTTTNTMLTSAGQTGTLFSANTAGTNLSANNKTSSFPALATATTTNVVNLSGSLFTNSQGDMEVSTHPQINSVSGATLSTNNSLFASTNQPKVTSVNNFTGGLFASATPASGVNGIIASSTSGTPFGNLFGNPQTTIINTAINTTTTTTSGQPFIFNIFQSSHTKTAPLNPTQSGSQMARPGFSTKSALFNQPQDQPSNSGFNFTAKNQASNSGFNFMAKNQASNSGFNFMANTANTAPNFSFNLQPSIGEADSSAPFTAPPGGFNLPPTATASRRKTKTATRNKPKRK